MWGLRFHAFPGPSSQGSHHLHHQKSDKHHDGPSNAGQTMRAMTFTLEETHGGGGIDLVVTGRWSAAAEACLRDGHADGLVLNYAKGYNQEDVSFLPGLPVRRLQIIDRSLADLSPVYSLADSLELLSVESDPSAAIELDELPGLQDLSAPWNQIRGSIRFATQLQRLFLLSYSEADFSALTHLTALNSLVLWHHPRVRSLDGIESMPWLSELRVSGGRRLEDITALGGAASPVLQILRLPGCRKVRDIAPLRACPSLRFFDLAEAGTIASVGPLSDLVSLERLHLYGSTTVADGDLGPIARLPRLTDFKMMNRRHYSPSATAIEESIANRSRGRWRRLREGGVLGAGRRSRFPRLRRASDGR